MGASRPAGQLDMLCSPQEFGEQSMHLHARQMMPHAEMRAVAEGDVRIGKAVDSKRIGIGKNGFVAIGGAEEERQRFAGTNLLAADLSVLPRGTHEMAKRRGPTVPAFGAAVRVARDR